MKQLTDVRLVAEYDKAHAALIRTDEIEVTEALTTELLHNRAFFDVLGRLVTYAVQGGLALRCEFGTDASGTVPFPDWTPRFGEER